MSLIRSESKIDFKNPLALLITSFASVQEDEETCSILSFETKPKSGVTEFVPSVTREYIDKHREELAHFLCRDEGKSAESFLSNQLTKFHVMQVSRKHKGKMKEDLSRYSPSEFFREETLEKALGDLMADKQIYGRLFVDGIDRREEMTPHRISIVASFLRQSGVIEAVYKYQGFSSHSLEYISGLYNQILPELQDPIKREGHFCLIRSILKGYEYSSMKERANLVLQEGGSLTDRWTIILGYIISATAKDFTIIIRISEDLSHLTSFDRAVEYQGKAYKVRVGVIDLEAKLYTKLPLYIKEVNEAYSNYPKYYNKTE